VVRFRLPSGKAHSLNSGETGSYHNTLGSAGPTIHVVNSGKTYTLRSGDHRSWWMAKEGRVGFDLN
jgi:hypothetical protein